MDFSLDKMAKDGDDDDDIDEDALLEELDEAVSLKMWDLLLCVGWRRDGKCCGAGAGVGQKDCWREEAGCQG